MLLKTDQTLQTNATIKKLFVPDILLQGTIRPGGLARRWFVVSGTVVGFVRGFVRGQARRARGFVFAGLVLVVVMLWWMSANVSCG